MLRQAQRALARRAAAAARLPPRAARGLSALGGGGGGGGGGASDGDDDDERGSPLSRPTTPWVRSVVSGVDLMRNAKYNKGLAFSPEERDRLYLRGLLPPAVLSQATQAERVLTNVRAQRSDLDKHTYLTGLQERNERLFYYVLERHTEELLPLLQGRVVGDYCAAYSLMFRSLPRGLYLSLADRGRVFSVLKNWPERRVKAVCLTNGEAVGARGDLGVQGVGAAVCRLAALTAAGGIDPSSCLPVVLDVGTDCEALLADPIYVGARHRRLRGEPFHELVDEFLAAVRRRFGASVLVDVEGASHETATALLARHRGEFPMYCDALHGAPAAVLAGVLAAARAAAAVGGGAPRPLAAQRLLLVGDSPALPAVAQLFEAAVSREAGPRGALPQAARANIWLADGAGLVTRGRAAEPADEALPYARDDAPPGLAPTLAAAVAAVRPTVLVGLSDGPPPHAFTPEVLAGMAAGCDAAAGEWPAVFALSGEAAASDAAAAFAAAGGRGSFCGGVNTALVAPGVGLGTLMSRSTRLRDEMLVDAARTLARLVPADDLANGALFPRVGAAREVAAHVAEAVAARAYAAGVATELPKPPSLLNQAKWWMFDPRYRMYR